MKKGKALGINFGTLEGICRALNCQPGDVLRLVSEKSAGKERAVKRKGKSSQTRR